MRKLIVVLALGLVVAAGAQAEKVYKWVDESGRVSYHPTPPPEGSNVKSEAKRVRGAPVSADDPAAEAAAKNPVVLYTAAQCAGCDLARAYLEKRKVPFTEKNVESDRALQDELKQKAGAVSVPTITVGNKVMKGYLESLLEGELDQAGYPKRGADTAETKREAK
jgi:glutaredoxin